MRALPGYQLQLVPRRCPVVKPWRWQKPRPTSLPRLKVKVRDHFLVFGRLLYSSEHALSRPNMHMRVGALRGKLGMQCNAALSRQIRRRCGSAF